MSQTLQQTCVVLAQLNAKPTLKFTNISNLVKVAISQELFSFEYYFQKFARNQLLNLLEKVDESDFVNSSFCACR
jgi:hypothetical protein